MATNYPDSIDSFTNPTGTNTLNNPSHSAQHANANDAIVAIETALGANPAGSALALTVGQVSAASGDVLTAGTGAGEVDDTGTPVWYKFKVDGVDYGVAAYPINS